MIKLKPTVLTATIFSPQGRDSGRFQPVTGATTDSATSMGLLRDLLGRNRDSGHRPSPWARTGSWIVLNLTG